MTKELWDQLGQVNVEMALVLSKGSISVCPTPDCGYIFALDEQLSYQTCTECNVSSCMFCRVPFHLGLTCKDFQAQKRQHEEEKLDSEIVELNKQKPYTY